VTLLFSTAIGLGAFLVFVVQPQVGKLVLPLLGGTPAVWNTCLVFFQISLLGGYFYAHLISRLALRLQVTLHVLVMLLAGALVLPVSIAAASAPPDIDTPSRWLFALLLVRVGAPFIAISATAPLLQRWLGGTRHPHAHDPYFLYSASNTGSLLALLAYPAVIEPALSLQSQSRLWTIGYVSLAGLIAITGAVAWRQRAPHAVIDPLDESMVDLLEPLTITRRLRWIALAAVPASLMLSVTTHLTTDVAAVPLLWVVPLSVYLLTFVLAFAKRPPLSHRWLCALLPVAVLPPLLTISLALTGPWWALLLAHLVALFVVAMVCHGELAADRPSVARLTQFYLWISVGGALGGLFNTLVAPLVFHSIAEYPLGLLAACLLRPDAARAGVTAASLGVGALRPGGVPAAPRQAILRRPFWRDLAWGVGALLLALIAARIIGFAGHADRATAAIALPLMLAMTQWPFSRRYAFCLAATLLAVRMIDRPEYSDLVIDRNFFGVVKVRVTPDNKYHVLMHGNILHGMQPLVTNANERPVSYYGPSGPIGQIFNNTSAGAPQRPRVGVVGLGIGTLIAYGRPHDQWTFFEINPNVVRIARDPRYFTYLSQSRAPFDIVMGEGRLNLARQPENQFDVLVLDAFTSDAIPTHLITREAVEMYLGKLKPGGILLLNISNKYVSLAPVLGAITRDLDLTGRWRFYLPTGKEADSGEFPATWVVIGRTPAALGPLAADARWEALPTDRRIPAWTDSYSSLLGVMKWSS
jgi:hypothetical protein